MSELFTTATITGILCLMIGATIGIWAVAGVAIRQRMSLQSLSAECERLRARRSLTAKRLRKARLSLAWHQRLMWVRRHPIGRVLGQAGPVGGNARRTN